MTQLHRELQHAKATRDLRYSYSNDLVYPHTCASFRRYCNSKLIQKSKPASSDFFGCDRAHLKK